MKNVAYLAAVLLSSLALLAQGSFDSLKLKAGTFFGGSRNDAYLLSVTIDKLGYVYGTGYCTDIVTTANAYQKSKSGSSDIMVFKLDPTLSKLIWSTYLGGDNWDTGGSIAVDDTGAVYVSGYTMSANFPSTVAADRKYLARGTTNYFACKLSSDGSRLIYSRILGNGVRLREIGSDLGTESAPKGTSLAINSKGEAFVFASTSTATNYTISSNAYQPKLKSGSDLVLTKLDGAGEIIYSTYLGGSAAETAGNIFCADGQIFLCGSTSSTDFPLKGTSSATSSDCFALRADDGDVFNPLGCLIFGSTNSDAATDIVFSKALNRVLICGTTQGSDMKLQRVFLPNQKNGGFVASIRSDLSSVEFTNMIGSGVTPTSVALYGTGEFCVAGYAIGSLPLTKNALRTVIGGRIDGFLLSFSIDGSVLEFGSYVGGGRDDYSIANISLIESGCGIHAIFGITTHSGDFPTTSNSYQASKRNSIEDQAALVLFSTPDQVKIHLDFGISSYAGPAGVDTTLEVTLKSDTNMSFPISFDVVFNNMMFEPADTIPSRKVGDDYYMKFDLPKHYLTDTAFVIARIPGKVMMYPGTPQPTAIANVVTPASSCATVASQVGSISIVNCFLEGRAVQLMDPLSLQLSPNPAIGSTTLRLTGLNNLTTDLVLLDALGREVFRRTIAQQKSSEHTLDLRNFPSGVYSISVSNALAAQTKVLVVTN